jgi:hypothetical protein
LVKFFKEGETFLVGQIPPLKKGGLRGILAHEFEGKIGNIASISRVEEGAKKYDEKKNSPWS